MTEHRIYPALSPALSGPARKVLRELEPRIVTSHHLRYYRYDLQCGHIVERRNPHRTLVYCMQCGADQEAAADLLDQEERSKR